MLSLQAPKEELTPQEVLERGPLTLSPAPLKKKEHKELTPEPTAPASQPAAKPGIPPPPPPPPGSRPGSRGAPPPPPPPPPGGKLATRQVVSHVQTGVVRNPALVRMYQDIIRRESGLGGRGMGSAAKLAASTSSPSGDNAARGMLLSELTSKSAYKQAIDADVKNQSTFVAAIASEVSGATFDSMEDVVDFTCWMDTELSLLLDETAVLKQCESWPAAKADTLRDAAAAYTSFKRAVDSAEEAAEDAELARTEALEVLASGHFEAADGGLDPAAFELLTSTLRSMESPAQAAHTRLWDLTKTRESKMEQWSAMGVPTGWLARAGPDSIAEQMQKLILAPATSYMKVVASFASVAAELAEAIAADENAPPGSPSGKGKQDARAGPGRLLPRHREHLDAAVRFAFRAHQAAGGFDRASSKAFEELQRAGIPSLSKEADAEDADSARRQRSAGSARQAGITSAAAPTLIMAS